MDNLKDPFDFYQSTWWKDMNHQLCVDGWPQVVVSLNCFVREAKEHHEKQITELQDENAKLKKALSEIFSAKPKETHK